MKVWIASFVLLFGLAELYQWVQHFTLPLPVFILGGAFLAIASNHDKRVGFPGQHPRTGTASAEPTPTWPTTLQPPLEVGQPRSGRSTSPFDQFEPFDQFAAGAKATGPEAAVAQPPQSTPPRSHGVSARESISFTIDPSKH